MNLHEFINSLPSPATILLIGNCSGLVGQCCDVVLVGAHLAQENPRGSGFRKEEGMGRDGNGEISLRATWDQGGRILSQQGGIQVSKREQKGEQRGISKGK
jgi:hypothetical protein